MLQTFSMRTEDVFANWWSPRNETERRPCLIWKTQAMAIRRNRMLSYDVTISTLPDAVSMHVPSTAEGRHENQRRLRTRPWSRPWRWMRTDGEIVTTLSRP